MNDIVNIISTVGFPISSCLLYMYYIYKDKNQSREENLKIVQHIAIVIHLCVCKMLYQMEQIQKWNANS